MVSRTILILAVGLAGMAIAKASFAQEKRLDPSVLDRYNYVVGTQTIGARYQFTQQSRLVETAEAIRAMGSNVLKIGLSAGYVNGHRYVAESDPKIRSLVELASQEPSHKRVLDMPFAYYLIWVYPFNSGSWRDGLSKADAEKEYREIYDLARYLLRTYRGSGKTFLLGHWEGDWHLRPNYDLNADIPPVAIQGMIDWLNTRQRAVDDAKRDVPPEGVQVYHYTEVNQAQIGIQGKKCLTSDVLPKTAIDFVSYSSYDSLGGDISANLRKALDYIESKLPPKPGVGIGDKRVFIGEYGFPAKNHGAKRQDELARKVMRAGVEWGCPFVLYWEMYCNEVEDGMPRGFWMIDNQGQKQPVYHTHQRFYAEARKQVEQFHGSHGRLPTPEEFRKMAAKLLD